MGIFYITIIATYVLSIFYNVKNDEEKNKGGFIFFILIVVVLVLVSGLRNGIGDTGVYILHFKKITMEKILNGMAEPGFYMFLLMLKTIYNDPQIMIFTTALITNLCNVYIFKKYSKRFELTIFLYITSGYYIITMNGIRQALVAAILFLATRWVEKGYFKKYVALILVLSTFHTSVLVMIPVYFIVRDKAWSKKTLIIILLASVGLLFYGTFFDVLIGSLEETKYGVYGEFNDGGTNILRIAVNFVPVILAFINRKELKEKWVGSNIFMNLSFLNCVIMCFAFFNNIFARFTMYFELYNFILIPMTIKYWPNKKEKRILYYLLIIFYLVFFWYDYAIAKELIYPSRFEFMNIFRFIGG